MNQRRPHFQHFFTGYLRLELVGQQLEPVLQEVLRQGVPLYYLRTKHQTATLGISLRDLRTLYLSCKSHRVKMRFIGKEGLPFLIRRWRRRKMFLLGVVLFLAILFVCRSLVWNVDVSGVDTEEQQAILQAAKSMGVTRGALLGPVRDVDRIQSELLRRVPSLMWVGVNVEGTKVRIQALKRVEGVQEKVETPHNIVAGKPAVIRKVFATRGMVTVIPGQAVSPGQVLISGVLGGGEKEVPATGVALAEVWYQSQVEVPLHVNQQALTGERVSFDDLQLGGLDLRVWGWRTPKFSASYAREDDTQWKIGNWTLPFTWRHITKYEATTDAVTHSTQEAEAKARLLARQDVSAQPGTDRTLLGQTVLHQEVKHGKLYATVLTRSEEDVGIPGKIPEEKTDDTDN